jgi:para-aminobenzoate synthetase component 1
MSAAPLVQELIPVPDPWDIARRLSFLPHLLFLDSAEIHSELGRYSYVAADPVEWIEIARVEYGGPDPFALIQSCWSRYLREPVAGLPPFQGGIAGLFGYGLGHAVERLPRFRIDEFGTPDLAVGIYDWVIAFDHILNRAWLIAPDDNCRKRVLACAACTPSSSHSPASGEIVGMKGPSRDSPALPWNQLSAQYPLPHYPTVTSDFDRTTYMDTIRRAIEYTHAGDCFQVNIAQRLMAPAPDSAFGLYGRLREHNPAPFAGYFDLGAFAIASASPERFLRVSDRQVETRPIKGTRPRGITPVEDAERAAELAASTKDRAENVMIVDLLRNDLGRVCEYGSVRVRDVCKVETYRFVHHLVSSVVGKLRADRTPFDLLRAAFPGGSVTGAPKVRAMEIIAELEPTARGPYCGSLGWIGFDGAMDSNILIRTFTIGKGWMQFPVGGGIVADSDPQREYEETLHKAAGLLRAL